MPATMTGPGAPGAPGAVAAPLVAPNWWLGILPRTAWRKKKLFTAYEADLLNIAAGATAIVNTPIQADSDFVWLGLSVLVTTTLNPPTLVWGGGFANVSVSGYLLDVTDVGSNQDLYQAPVPIDNVAGSGPYPRMVEYPYTFRRASAIKTTVIAMASNVPASNVRVTYLGVRVFDLPED